MIYTLFKLHQLVLTYVGSNSTPTLVDRRDTPLSNITVSASKSWWNTRLTCRRSDGHVCCPESQRSPGERPQPARGTFDGRSWTSEKRRTRRTAQGRWRAERDTTSRSTSRPSDAPSRTRHRPRRESDRRHQSHIGSCKPWTNAGRDGGREGELGPSEQLPMTHQ